MKKQSNSKLKGTIVYDGSCRFCLAQIERIKSWDQYKLFAYLPRQDPSLASRFPFLSEMNLEEGMRLVTSDNSVYVGADAVYQIARRLPRARFIAWLYLLPICKQIAQLAYALIAANRQRLGKTCKNNACEME
ncbi:MAG: DUF393 domain-containing protein [Candidatus Obscuribacterales bacterium]|nr:DUF393 domain-containing protein [Candidatus Obscuribacterales bacterium]